MAALDFTMTDRLTSNTVMVQFSLVSHQYSVSHTLYIGARAHAHKRGLNNPTGQRTSL
jgi:hypothetical protein